MFRETELSISINLRRDSARNAPRFDHGREQRDGRDSAACAKFRRFAASAASCCTATWCSRLARSRIDLSLVDAASFAAHKFYGPKGTGFLFLRSGLSIQPIMFGGAHENERRPGTENVAAIAGMAAAAEWTLTRETA